MDRVRKCIEDIQSFMEKTDKILDTCESVGIELIDFYAPAYALVDQYVDSMTPYSDAISLFIWENEFGKRCLETDDVKITNVDEFIATLK